MLALVGLVAVVTAQTRDDGPLFEEVAASVGLTFTYENGAVGQFYVPEVMGAGAALIDYDNDGDLDVYLLQGQSLDPKAPRDAARTHRLFRNELIERKTLRFTDVTAGSGLGGTSYAMGVATGDYDNDGDQDVYVTALGPDTLYRNNGDGTFTDVTAAAGVGDDRWSTATTFLDYDRDGDLDLFVVNYVDFSIAANKQCFDPVGTRDYCGPRSYRSVPDRLFRNEGGGRFTDVTDAAGITKADGAGLGWKWDRVNVHGGAIALGHPIGASGARVLTTLLYAMQDRNARTGLATLCLGGGDAVAMSVERES